MSTLRSVTCTTTLLNTAVLNNGRSSIFPPEKPRCFPSTQANCRWRGGARQPRKDCPSQLLSQEPTAPSAATWRKTTLQKCADLPKTSSKQISRGSRQNPTRFHPQSVETIPTKVHNGQLYSCTLLVWWWYHISQWQWLAKGWKIHYLASCFNQRQ